MKKNNPTISAPNFSLALKLISDPVERDISSYVDPNGYVFQHEGAYYRAIYATAAPLYRELLNDGSVDSWISRHHLVDTAIADIQLQDPDVALVLKHRKIEPATYCVEWCASMLRDAGLALIDLALAVLDRDCILQDCYPYNIVFEGTVPVIVDFTSIVRSETPLLWPAFEQFQSFFLRPLYLATQGKWSVARSFLYDVIHGLSLSDLLLASGAAFKFRHPSFLLQRTLERFVNKNRAVESRITQSLGSQRPERSIRRRFLLAQKQKLKAFHFERGKDVWSEYYSDIQPGIDKENKKKVIENILRNTAPRTVVDLGCNTGVFSLIASHAGASVVSVDSSAQCIERLYAIACRENLKITPLLMDLVCPTPAFGFLSQQFPSFANRIQGEMVFFLGIMHHIHIASRQSFEHIARLLDAVSTKYLLFEFIDCTDDNNKLINAGRLISYSIEDVTKCLVRYFPSIEVQPSDRATRKLLLCSK